MTPPETKPEPRDSIHKIKQCISFIRKITARDFRRPEEVETNLHTASAVKFLVVRIGEYFNEYCDLNGPMTDGYIEGISVKSLHKCRMIRNSICHKTEMKADGSFEDISATELLSLLQSLRAQRVVEEEEEEVTKLEPPRVNTR